jgi:hypothetical protein
VWERGKSFLLLASVSAILIPSFLSDQVGQLYQMSKGNLKKLCGFENQPDSLLLKSSQLSKLRNSFQSFKLRTHTTVGRYSQSRNGVCDNGSGQDCLWIWWCSSTASCTRDSQMRISIKPSLCGLRRKRNANFDSVTSATGTPQESRIWDLHFVI